VTCRLTMKRRVILVGFDALVPTVVERFSEEGSLPSISKMMASGAYARCLPCFPGMTPQNWTTMATGAYPGIHGITDFNLHKVGEPLEGSSAFRSSWCKAEYIWNTAEQHGKKCLLVNYIASYPPTIRKGILIGGDPSFSGSQLKTLRPYFCFVTEKAAVREGVIVQLVPARNWNVPVARKPAPLETRIALCDEKRSGPSYDLLVFSSNGSVYDRVFICKGKNVTRRVADLSVGQWSDWIVDTFEELEGAFKFKLVELSPDASVIRLYCTRVFPTNGFTTPTEIAAELVKEVGPLFCIVDGRPYILRWVDAATFIEEGSMQANWVADAVNYLVGKYGCDLVYSHIHFFDNFQHAFWGGFDPISPIFVPEEEGKYERLFLDAYSKVADSIVEKIVKKADENTFLVFVSDHGHIPFRKMVSINNLLAREGLVSGKLSSDGEPLVDWSRTKAWATRAGGHIYLNLRGREPTGVVHPEDYESMQDRVIDVLLGLRDPDNGERPVSMALKKEEARSLGLGGDTTGDVVYAMRKGYVGDNNWFPLTSDLSIFREAGAEGGMYSRPTSVHGCCLPSVDYGKGTEMAVFFLWGPEIKEGYKRESPIRMVDIAPTIAHILGVPAPAQSEGSILFDMFE